MGKLTIHKASKKALVRFLNLLLIFSLFLPYFTPTLVIAQDLSNIQEENITEIPIDEPENVIKDDSSTPIFQDGIYTIPVVQQGQEYIYPENSRVRVKFTSITEEGNFIIKKIPLSQDDKDKLNTTEEYAWDFTSTMSNSSFTYDLVLPNDQGNEIEVKYTENGENYISIDNTQVNENTVTINGLNHFTLFVVTFEDPQSPTPIDPGYNDIWLNLGDTITRVPSGTNGITSSDGDYHAEITGSVFTRWNGYENSFPLQGYDTSVDVYLDMNKATGEDKRFDFSSAINDPFGSHRRDFIFNLGTKPGTSGQWLVSASNNVPGWPGNPGRNPLTLSTTGWYTLEQQFRKDINNQLVVTLNIYQRGNSTPLRSWVLTDPSDIIGSTIGGNRYGWFIPGENPNNFFSNNSLAIDNATINQFNDSTAPIVELTSPIDNYYTNQTSVPQTWTSSHTDIDYYEYRSCSNDPDIDQNCNLIYTITTASTSRTVNNNNITFWWQVRAVDLVGNIGDWTEAWKITIDTISPSTPTNLRYETLNQDPVSCGSLTNQYEIIAKWDNSTDPSGIKYYEYQSFNPPTGWLWGTPKVYNTERKGAFSVGDGTYGFRIRAVDNAGNLSEWTSQDFNSSCKITYDGTVPEAPSIQFPLNEEYFNTIPILNKWTIVNDISGIKEYRIEYIYDDNHTFPGGLYRTVTINQRNHIPGIFEQGGVTIRVQAIDNAGNEGLWSNPVHYYYDATPPETPQLISPENNSIVKGAVLTNSWSEISDANYYEYESYYDEGLQHLRFYQKIFTTSKTAYNVPNATFWWRVRSTDLAGNSSPWSDAWKVTVDNTLPLLSEVEDITLEDEQAIPLAVVTTTETNINQLCFTLEGPLGDYPESCIDITGNFDVISTILNKYGKSALTHVDTDLLPIGEYTLNYYVTDKAGNVSSHHDFVLTIVKKLLGLENAQQQVLGTQTTNGGTQRNTRATVRAITRITELLGTGGPDEEEDPVVTQAVDEEVKGAQTCDNPSTLSGYIYLDSNSNNKRDENEKIYSDISIRVYQETDGSEETIKQITTNEDGYWETKLCTGEYFVKADGNKLPDNFVLGKDTMQVNIVTDKNTSADFAVEDKRNFLQKNWPWMLLAIVTFGGVGIVLMDSRRKKDYL